MHHVIPTGDRGLVALLVAASTAVLPLSGAAQSPGMPLQLAQATGAGSPEASAPAAGPRKGSGASALKVEAPPPTTPAEPDPPRVNIAQGLRPQVESAAAAPESGEGQDPGWGIAPIRWGGNFALDFRSLSGTGQPRRTQDVESLTLKANSYLWQPWFAGVSGELGLYSLHDRTRDDSAPSQPASSSVTGSANLALFPVSRFPFNASYARADTAVSDTLATTRYLSERTNVNQSYTPPQGGSNWRIGYTQSDITSNTIGVDRARAFDASMGVNGGASALRVTGQRYANIRTSTGDTSRTETLNANHNLRPGRDITVDTLVNYNSSAYSLTSAGLPLETRSRLGQVYTNLMWLPGGNSPWRVTGGLRLFDNRAETGGAIAETRSESANAAVNYALNRHTNLNGGGTSTRAWNGAAYSYMQSQTAGVSYTPDLIRLGDFVYLWNTGANTTHQSASSQPSRQTSGGTIGHQIRRPIVLDRDSVLEPSARQSYTRMYDTVLTLQQTRTHSAGLSWNVRPSESASTRLALDATDSVITDATQEQHFRMVAFNANGQVRTSRFASASATLAVNRLRQYTIYAAQPAPSPGTVVTVVPEPGYVTTAMGNISFQHANAFGVPRLRYHVLYNVSRTRNPTRFEGDINAAPEPVTESFEQRLEYSIGRLEIRFSMSFARMRELTTGTEQTNGLVFLRLLRSFGNV